MERRKGVFVELCVYHVASGASGLSEGRGIPYAIEVDLLALLFAMLIGNGDALVALKHVIGYLRHG